MITNWPRRVDGTIDLVALYEQTVLNARSRHRANEAIEYLKLMESLFPTSSRQVATLALTNAMTILKG